MKLTSLSLGWYGKTPTGSMHFSSDNGGSVSIPLTLESAEALAQVAYDVFRKEQKRMAEDLLNVETPTLLGYDESKTIDETPF